MTEVKNRLPTVERPWLKYYSEDVLKTTVPQLGMYDFVYENNKDFPNNTALNYFGRKTSYGEFFKMIDTEAKAFAAQGG